VAHGIGANLCSSTGAVDLVFCRKPEQSDRQCGSGRNWIVCGWRLGLAPNGQGTGAGGSLSQNALPVGDYRDTTQGVYGTEYRYNANLAQLNVLPLNNHGYDGTGVKVAVVDSGIDARHPEFRNSTIHGYDFSNSATGYRDDPNGHGTHVASIIAGVTVWSIRVPLLLKLAI
jgi:subtilisin family serine protease